VLDARGPVL
ncbi:hypothetical protein PybrP1_009111, partial [[Pythium] brassicae (nom. inval.)]